MDVIRKIMKHQTHEWKMIKMEMKTIKRNRKLDHLKDLRKRRRKKGMMMRMKMN